MDIPRTWLYILSFIKIRSGLLDPITLAIFTASCMKFLFQIILAICILHDSQVQMINHTGVMYLSVNGTWGPWSQWSICSRTCDIGQRRRVRRCDSPPPTNGGFHCNYSGDSAVDVVNCKMDDCPDVTPTWNNWGPWSACSVTCSNGTSARNRTCSMFSMCSGKNSEMIDCILRPCPGLF